MMGWLQRAVNRHRGLLSALLLVGLAASLSQWRPTEPRVRLPEYEGRLVEFAPGGRVMLTDGQSGACLRDVATGRVVVELISRGPNGMLRAREVSWPRFTPDGRWLIVQLGGRKFGADNRVTLAVFDTATGQQSLSFPDIGSQSWWNWWSSETQYALSQDGSRLAFCRMGDDRKSRVTVWDLSAKKTLAEFPGFYPLAFSPDGSMLAHGELGQYRPFPRTRSLEPARAGGVHSAATGLAGVNAGAVAFSPDGKLLAAQVIDESDRQIQIRDVNSHELLAELVASPPPMQGGFFAQKLWFSPDGRMLLAKQAEDRWTPARVQCWDLSGRAPRAIIQAMASSVTSDGSRAAIADSNLITVSRVPSSEGSVIDLFDLPATEPRARVGEKSVGIAVISPDGRVIALPSYRNERQHPLPLFAFARKVYSAVKYRSWSTANFHAAIEAHNSRRQVHEIRFRDAATGRVIEVIDCSHRKYPAEGMKFSPDSKTLVVSYRSEEAPKQRTLLPEDQCSVELWDVPGGWRAVPWLRGAALMGLVLSAAVLDRRTCNSSHLKTQLRRPSNG